MLSVELHHIFMRLADLVAILAHRLDAIHWSYWLSLTAKCRNNTVFLLQCEIAESGGEEAEQSDQNNQLAPKS